MDDVPLIGWREWLALPALGWPEVKAKIDTGGRSSSLHVASVEAFERDGCTWLRFAVAPRRRGGRRQWRRGRAHEIARARPCLHPSFAFQLQAGLHRGGGADAVVRRQLPDRRQALAGTQRAALDLLAQLGGERFVQEHAGGLSVSVHLQRI
jgi:hypothetical protein